MGAIRKMILKTVISTMLIIIGAIAGIWGPGASPAFASTSGWEVKGQAGFSEGVLFYPTLFVSYGLPYVACVDGHNLPRVMLFIDNEWQPLGTPGTYPVSSVAFFVADGFPYIVFGEMSSGSTGVAKMYSWQYEDWRNVGLAGISDNEALFTSLYVDDGTPYVVYGEKVGGSAVNLRISVKKYAGGDWSTVGEPGFSGEESEIPHMVVRSGTPYVVYTSGSSNQITVKKLEGSSWVDVGSPNFAQGSNPRLAMNDTDDALYVAFNDDQNNWHATVMRYNAGNNSWEYVGEPGTAAARDMRPAIRSCWERRMSRCMPSGKRIHMKSATTATATMAERRPPVRPRITAAR